MLYPFFVLLSTSFLISFASIWLVFLSVFTCMTCFILSKGVSCSLFFFQMNFIPFLPSDVFMWLCVFMFFFFFPFLHALFLLPYKPSCAFFNFVSYYTHVPRCTATHRNCLKPQQAHKNPAKSAESHTAKKHGHNLKASSHTRDAPFVSDSFTAKEEGGGKHRWESSRNGGGTWVVN